MILLKDLPALADRLAYLRRVKNLTQAELAALAGTSQQAIQQAESGQARNPRYLARLAKALAVPLEWLALNERPADKPSARQGFNEKEDQALGAFRSLSAKDQDLMLELMKSRTAPARDKSGDSD